MTTTWAPLPLSSRPLYRVGTRFLLAVPLMVIGIRATLAGHVEASLSALLDQARSLGRSGFSLDRLSAAYPPAPVLIALAVGASAVGVVVVASILAGSALHAAWEKMAIARVPLLTQIALIASVTLIPAVWEVATQDLAAIGGLAMLVIALEGFIRFAFDGDTSGGFTAGLFLAASFFFDPAALVYAVSLALAAPLLASARYRGEKAATSAILFVLCFPIAAVLAGWAFLEWRFTGTFFTFLHHDLGLFGFSGGALHSLGSAALGVVEDVVRAPVYLVVGGAIALRRPIIALGYLLPIVGLVLVHWVGLPYSAATTIVLLTFLAMISVPNQPDVWLQRTIVIAVLAQLLINMGLS